MHWRVVWWIGWTSTNWLQHKHQVFWEDAYTGPIPLVSLFDNLYRLAVEQHASVASFWRWRNKKWSIKLFGLLSSYDSAHLRPCFKCLNCLDLQEMQMSCYWNWLRMFTSLWSHSSSISIVVVSFGLFTNPCGRQLYLKMSKSLCG